MAPVRDFGTMMVIGFLIAIVIVGVTGGGYWMAVLVLAALALALTDRPHSPRPVARALPHVGGDVEGAAGGGDGALDSGWGALPDSPRPLSVLGCAEPVRRAIRPARRRRCRTGPDAGWHPAAPVALCSSVLLLPFGFVFTGTPWLHQLQLVLRVHGDTVARHAALRAAPSARSVTMSSTLRPVAGSRVSRATSRTSVTTSARRAARPAAR